MLRKLVTIGLTSALIAVASAGAAAADDSFLIRSNGSFGAESNLPLTPTNVDPEGKFGAATKQRSEDACYVKWSAAKAQAEFFKFPEEWGLDQSDDPCNDGYLTSMRATSKKWKTWNGVSVGKSKSLAKRKSIGSCSGKFRGSCYYAVNGKAHQVKRGYVLSSVPCEAAGGNVPGVIAVTPSKKVTSLIVLHPTCE